jgi:hypothetical protein
LRIQENFLVVAILAVSLWVFQMPSPASQTFLRELDMNGAERHGRPSNVARTIRAGARIKLWTAATKLPAGTELNMEKGFSTPLNKPRPYKITSTGKLIDDALGARPWKPRYART